MQQLLPVLDDASKAFYAEYMEIDPVSGENRHVSLDEKEQLYLECLDAFYNGGNRILLDEVFDALKYDLHFAGSRVSALTKDEVKFLIAAKRFAMGTPILSDSEYDGLRGRLKREGSTVVLHEIPSASSTEAGVAKMDLRVDSLKQRLLYLPALTLSLLLTQELCAWSLHLDPLVSLLLGALPSFYLGKWLTENFFAREALATQTSCPHCTAPVSVYFGDLLGVISEGMAGEPPNTPLPTQLSCVCPRCKGAFTADRTVMLAHCRLPPHASAFTPTLAAGAAAPALAVGVDNAALPTATSPLITPTTPPAPLPTATSPLVPPAPPPTPPHHHLPATSAAAPATSSAASSAASTAAPASTDAPQQSTPAPPPEAPLRPPTPADEILRPTVINLGDITTIDVDNPPYSD